MKTLQERVAEDGISAEATPRTAPADGRDWGAAHWYNVTLTRGDQSMTVPFGMGSALTDEPTAEVVLDALCSDASTYEQADGFEDWAGELGFDTDSRKAERTYRQVGAQVRELEAFLGNEYHDYLYDTERL